MQIYEHWLMATLQSIAWKWKKCFHHICTRWKCSKENHLLMVFQNSRFFCLNFMLQVNCMQTAYWNGLNYQTSSESDSSSLSKSSKSESMLESFSWVSFSLQGLNDRYKLRLVHFSFWWELQFFRICGEDFTVVWCITRPNKVGPAT